MEMQEEFNGALQKDVIFQKKITAIGEDKLGAFKSENFFSKKKKKWIFLWGVLFLIIIFISIKFLLNINLIRFLSDLSDVSNVPYFLATIIFGFLSFAFCEVFIRIITLKTKLGNKLKNAKKFDWISFSIISFVIQSITPFSLGSEPYSVWWLNKKGISLKDASAVVAVTSFCWFIGQFLITWPSFIFITVKNWEKVSSLNIDKTYWAILVGLFVDMGVAAFIFVISYSRKAHYHVSSIANKIKRYFGFQYSTQDEIVQKYLKNNVFQKLYVKELLQKTTLKVIFWYLLNNLWVYFMFVFMYRLFNSSGWSWDKFWLSYNVINVSTTANNFLPLPSAEGSLQVVIQNLMSSINSSNVNSSTGDGNTIFLWRFFNKYLGMFIGVIFVSVYGFNVDNSSFFKKIKKSRQDLKTVHELTF